LEQLRLEVVRRPLVDAIEPVDVDVHLGTLRLVARVERRFGKRVLEMAQDGGRVEDDAAVVLEHRHEPLPADALDRRAVVGIDPHKLDLEALVRERERHALDVRREAEAVELHAEYVPTRWARISARSAASRSASTGSRSAVVIRIAGGVRRRQRSPAITAQPRSSNAATTGVSCATGP